jgi:hypothetical protein
MKFFYSLEAAQASVPEFYAWEHFEAGVMVYLTELSYQYHKLHK